MENTQHRAACEPPGSPEELGALLRVAGESQPGCTMSLPSSLLSAVSHPSGLATAQGNSQCSRRSQPHSEPRTSNTVNPEPPCSHWSQTACCHLRLRGTRGSKGCVIKTDKSPAGTTAQCRRRLLTPGLLLYSGKPVGVCLYPHNKERRVVPPVGPTLPPVWFSLQLRE